MNSPIDFTVNKPATLMYQIKQPFCFLKLFFETCLSSQVGLKFMILLSQPSLYWDYRHVSPHQARLFIFYKICSAVNVDLHDSVSNKCFKT